MNIAITADPELPVPPRFYGGIERIIDLLARGLVQRGHEVTIFAHGESTTAGRLVPWPGTNSQSLMHTLSNSAVLAKEVARRRFDVVHSFSRIAYLTPILPLPLPKLMSYQRAITERAIQAGYALSRGTLAFTAISKWMMSGVDHIGQWSLIPNAVPLDAYDFVADVPKNGPLVFLGRIEEIKGPHLAIEIAKRSNSSLVIAGNVPDGKEAWFEHHIFPHLDGERIRYIGPVDDQQKNSLLGSARAFLMPILWDEPFGIVMIEAMACGTPVLGLRRGSVEEVVEDGVTGFVSDTVDGLASAVSRLPDISRAACRARVEKHYSADVVVEKYLELYRAMMERCRP